MRLSFIPNIAIVTLLLAGAAVEAQSTNFTQRRYPDVTGSYQSGLNVYYKTWSDLDQAQRRVVAFPGDGYRYSTAMGQMDLLERTWQDGSFERSQITDAISNVQFVLRFNNMSAQDRKVLTADLDQLHEIQLRYGH